MKDIDVDSVCELQPGKLYHVRILPPFDKENIQAFMKALNRQGVKAIITSANFGFEEMKSLFEKITSTQKEELLRLLKSEDQAEFDKRVEKEGLANSDPAKELEDEQQGKFEFNVKNHELTH